MMRTGTRALPNSGTSEYSAPWIQFVAPIENASAPAASKVNSATSSTSFHQRITPSTAIVNAVTPMNGLTWTYWPASTRPSSDAELNE